jgi:hypothetical protein
MHHAARGIIFPGVIAGLINGIVEMVSEGIAGAGFWSPVVFYRRWLELNRSPGTQPPNG